MLIGILQYLGISCLLFDADKFYKNIQMRGREYRKFSTAANTVIIWISNTASDKTFKEMIGNIDRILPNVIEKIYHN